LYSHSPLGISKTTPQRLLPGTISFPEDRFVQGQPADIFAGSK